MGDELYANHAEAIQAALAPEPARIQITDEMVGSVLEALNEYGICIPGENLKTALEAAFACAPSQDDAKCKHGFAQAHDWVSRGISGQQSCPGSSAPSVHHPSRKWTLDSALREARELRLYEPGVYEPESFEDMRSAVRWIVGKLDALFDVE